MLKNKFCWLLLLLCSIKVAAQPQLITVSDTLYSQTGQLANGTVLVFNPNVFTTKDGYVISQGFYGLASVVNGVFSINLAPNSGSTPAGTFYTVEYQLTGGQDWQEVWIVPSNVSPLRLAQVRAYGPQQVAPLFSMQQIVPPANCLNAATPFPFWSVNQWDCAAGGSGGGGGPGFVDETPTGAINGSNTSFTTSQAPNPALSLKLWFNGVLQLQGSNYTLSGNAISLLFTPQTGDSLFVAYRVPGASGGPNFADNETPGGAINGSNTIFTLVHTPNPAIGLELYWNGVILIQGAHYTISGNTVTLLFAPQTGDNLVAFYRY